MLRVSYILISVTTLCNMMNWLWMCKGCTRHAKVVDFKSGCNTTNEFDIVWPICVKQECKNKISDKIY